VVIGAFFGLRVRPRSSDLDPGYYSREDLIPPSAPDGIDLARMLTSAPTSDQENPTDHDTSPGLAPDEVSGSVPASSMQGLRSTLVTSSLSCGGAQGRTCRLWSGVGPYRAIAGSPVQVRQANVHTAETMAETAPCTTNSSGHRKQQRAAMRPGRKKMTTRAIEITI